MLKKFQSFADVPITDKGVDTVKFIEASEGLVGLFGRFSKAIPGVFSFLTFCLKIYWDLLLSLSCRMI